MDISSFEVTGTIRYKGGPFPVEGVSLLIDGRPAFDGDGNLIFTDALGQFTIDVPVGEHSITANLTNHTFEEGGRFPPPTPEDDAPLFDFQAPVFGIEFVDNTLVKVAGRVVGGPVEAAKPLGFGLSKNNIGNATFSLTSQKGLDLTFEDSTQVTSEFHAGQEINTTAQFITRNITVNPDTETGEFVLFLPPEVYEISSVQAGSYIFDQSFLTTLDLTTAFLEKEEVFTDTVAAEVDGEVLATFLTFDEEDYDETSSFLRNDTLFVVSTDRFDYQKRQNFTLRNSPDISVTTLTGSELLGEEEYLYIDRNLGVEEAITLKDENAGTYTFGHPVFLQRRTYQLKASVFEEYVNIDNGLTDRVPVIDGELEIENGLAINTETVLPLNSRGEAFYEFTGGLPNLNFDTQNSANSFTHIFNITAVTGETGALRTVYREGDPLRGLLFGGIGTGNNFVTTGPSQITNILRDPPGSLSTSFFESNTTSSTENTWSVADINNQDTNATIHLGMSTTTFQGIGVGTIDEATNAADVSAGLETQQTYTSDSTVVTTTTFTERYATSSGEQFVGRDGDVFIGYSTNLIYGNTTDLQPIPASQCGTDDCGEIETANGYRLGFVDALRINPEINTFFVLTQQTIETNTIPSLKAIRDNFLIYSTQPDTINPVDEPVYISLVAPEDPRYGSDNGNTDVWGTAATRAIGQGPSYVIKVPQSFIDEERFVSDTLFYYNQEIKEFKDILAANEAVKLNSKFQDNFSFDGGTSIERSITVSNATITGRTKEFLVNPSIGGEKGGEFEVLGTRTGITVNTRASFGDVNGDGTTTTEESTTTYGYVLEDGNLGDTYSVDVFEASDGYGPVFSTRGGQTSCPYEPEYVTQYFEPGTLLSAATARREGPVITAEESVLNNIPDNRAAQFTVFLSTDSETNEAFNYTLMIDPTTNPDGAAIAVNGSDIGDGFSFLVEPGELLEQTITIEQGRPDIFAYEDLRFMLVSQCQFDPTDPLPDLADTVHLSAFFVPGCSDIAISNPGENWVVNTNTPQQDTLLVTLDSYDLNFSNFKRLQFQYRPAGTANFTTDMTFYNAQQVSQAEFDAANEPKMWLSESSVTYPFDMSSLPDQEYDIRAVALCDEGPGVTRETPTEVLRGTKDTQRPQLFGAAQPADGILSANDNISIRFSEPIAAGLITPANIQLQGVLNNAPVDNSVSVTLDGVNDYIRIEDGLNLSKSFTIEFKFKRNELNREMVLFSKGITADNLLEIGFTADNRLFIEVNGQRQETSLQFFDTVSFNHLAISYDAEAGEFFAYENDRYILEAVSLSEEFSGNGPIAIGRSTVGADRYAAGNLLDLRIWDRFRNLPDVFAGINTMLSATEIGLVGYWPFDEGLGSLATDRARFRNATLFADWLVLPQGYALSFDGQDDYLEISTAGTVVIGPETDFTIEFWFKTGTNARNQTLFSAGRGVSGTAQQNAVDDPTRSLSISFNDEENLVLSANGETVLLNESPGSLTDQNWHHLAIATSRVGNSSIVIDGEQVMTLPSDQVGSILRASMTLGARGYNIGTTAVTRDQFFEGSLDEFRIWGSARNATQVQLNRTARLEGDEPGLLAYYPFDGFANVSGVQLLQPNVDDQDVNPFGPNGGTAVTNGASFSTNTPNIKLTRPVQDVPFSFVVNEDELIITPSESVASIIERSVLEITVDRIEDLFENRLASPITFTAFVNRNQVRWGEEAIEQTVALNEGLQFSVDIVNLGGTEERFELVNLPLWLTATPQSGAIAPQSRLTIDFEVNPGLNVGYYNEDIFLATDFGFNEKLNLYLTVQKPGPDWQLDPTQFEFSMSMVASLQVDGVLSRDENDSIAAYVGNELRGAARLQYVQEFDQFMVFMDIYSNDADENIPIEFRAFDADQGIEYRELAPINPVFANNAIIGAPSSPQILSTGALRSESIGFASGFSWRSFNLNSPDLDATADLLAGVNATTNDRVVGDNVFDIFTEGLGWQGSISAGAGIETDTYYLFYLQNGGDIELVGTALNPNDGITIVPGYNRIGFQRNFSLDVNEAFASISPEPGDLIRGQFAFAVFEQGIGWIGTLENLQPNQGYLYFSNASANKELVYPVATFLSGSNRSPNDLASSNVTTWDHENPWEVAVHQFPLNMSLIGDLDVENPERYVMSAYDADGVLRGVAEPVVEQGLTRYYLTVYGDNAAADLSFKAFDRQSGTTYRLVNELVYQPNTLIGSRAEAEIFRLDGVDIPTSAASKAFPNPFEEGVNIRLAIPSRSVQMQISNMDGKVLYTLEAQSPKLIWELFWDGRSGAGTTVPDGMYLVKLVMDGHPEFLKIIKQ